MLLYEATTRIATGKASSPPPRQVSMCAPGAIVAPARYALGNPPRRDPDDSPLSSSEPSYHGRGESHR